MPELTPNYSIPIPSDPANQLQHRAAWIAMDDALISGGGITNSAGNNVIPKSDGTNLIASRITDNGTDILLASNEVGIGLGDASLALSDSSFLAALDATTVVVGRGNPALEIKSATNDIEFGNGSTVTFGTAPISLAIAATLIRMGDPSLSENHTVIEIDDLAGTIDILTPNGFVTISDDLEVGGLLTTGNAPTSLTNVAGKLLPAAINGYPADATKFLDGAGGWTVPVAGSGATTALDNLASVAINAALVLATNDAFALGSPTKGWSDLHLAEGAVINWDNGDLTLTQAGNLLTLAGGDLELTGALGVGIVNTASGTIKVQGAQGTNGFAYHALLARDGAGANQETDLTFDPGATATWSALAAFEINVGGGLPFLIRTGSANRLIIEAGGNVGIGTTTPDSKLDVEGVISSYQGATNPASSGAVHGLTMGYDNNTEHSWIQSLREDTSNIRQLELNPLGGIVCIGTVSPTISGTGKLHMAADTMRLDTPRTPASASHAGNAGEICWDADFIYVCTATNTWKRVAIATW